MQSPQMLESGRSVPPALVRTVRILWGSMLMGQVMAGLVFFCIRQPPAASNASLPLNLMIGIEIVLLLAGIAAAAFIPGALLKPGLSNRMFHGAYVSSMLIPMAVLEGAGFFGIIIGFLSQKWWPAALVPMISLAVQLTRFPRAVVD